MTDEEESGFDPTERFMIYRTAHCSRCMGYIEVQFLGIDGAKLQNFDNKEVRSLDPGLQIIRTPARISRLVGYYGAGPSKVYLRDQQEYRRSGSAREHD